MTAMYEISKYEINQVNDRFSLPVKVRGYWSTDSIRLYVRRSYEGVWYAELSHSSGGRDTNVVSDDLEAETNFGMALIAIAQEGRAILAQKDVLESNFQRIREEQRASAEAEIKRQEALIAEDTALGEEKASELVKHIKNIMRMSNRFSADLSFYQRGSVNTDKFEVKQRQNISFRHGIYNMTTASLVKMLANSSHRSWDSIIASF